MDRCREREEERRAREDRRVQRRFRDDVEDSYYDEGDDEEDDEGDLIVSQYFRYDGTPAHPDDKVAIVQRAPLREWRRIMEKEDGNVRYEM